MLVNISIVLYIYIYIIITLMWCNVINTIIPCMTLCLIEFSGN